QTLYLASLKQSPSLTADQFVNDFKKILSTKAVKSIHKDLLTEVEKNSSHPKLPDYFDANCLENLFVKFEKDFTIGSKPSSKKESPLVPIAKLLADGLAYSQSISHYHYATSLNDLRSMCKNYQSYNSLDNFLTDPKLSFLFEA